MIIKLPKKAYYYLSAITVVNISESFTHNMAAKTSWHRYETKLRHCHRMCFIDTIGLSASRERKCADTVGTVLVPWAGHFQR